MRHAATQRKCRYRSGSADDETDEFHSVFLSDADFPHFLAAAGDSDADARCDLTLDAPVRAFAPCEKQDDHKQEEAIHAASDE